jgi:beta-ketoacyl ACP synthase
VRREVKSGVYTGYRARFPTPRPAKPADHQPGGVDIDHINAHATGTTIGDLAEARAIRRVLSDHMAAVYATKPALGTSLGAAGAVEAVLTVQARRDGVVPPPST